MKKPGFTSYHLCPCKQKQKNCLPLLASPENAISLVVIKIIWLQYIESLT